MSYKEGKWLHDNMNNGPHDCKKKEKNGNGNGNNDINVEVLLKKLQSMGITIDINKLRNVK